MNQWGWFIYEVLGAPTFSFRSLQLRQPNRDFRRVLLGRSRTSKGSVDVIVIEGNWMLDGLGMSGSHGPQYLHLIIS